MTTCTLHLTPRRRQRLALALLLALFVVPLLLAWILVGQWRPGATAQHGRLLDPARPVAALRVATAEGVLDAGFLRGRWTLAYLNPAAGCDPACRQGLYAMRQVRLALGRDLERTQGLLMNAAAADARTAAWLAEAHPELHRGVADAATRNFFRDAFSGPEAGIYLIDPLGNLLMGYGPHADPKGLLADLKRLLKLSKIG